MNFKKLTDSGVNVDTLLNRLMGNASLVGMFIKKFTEDDNFQKLQAAFAQKDARAAEMASHTLKGMCGNLSLDVLFALFSEQVATLRSGQFEKAEAMMENISPIYNCAVFGMLDWLQDNE